MIKRLFLIVFVFGSVLIAQGKAPDIKLKALDGQTVQLYSLLKDGPVLINFWATWCAPCKKEMIYLNEFEQKYKKDGFSVLAISIDSPKSLSQVRSYIRNKRFSFKIFLDPNKQIFTRLNGNLMPTNILLDKSGQILWRHYGYLPGDEKKMEAEIRNALKISS